MTVGKERPGNLSDILTLGESFEADALEYFNNADWFYQHLEEIQEEHEGQTVLILNRQIIYNGEDAEEARTVLRGLGDHKNQCYVHYVPRVGEMKMI